MLEFYVTDKFTACHNHFNAIADQSRPSQLKFTKNQKKKEK